MVLDASVILKWFLREADSEKSMALKDGHLAGRFTITVPDILLYEVGNALRYEPEFSDKEVNRCLGELYELNLDIIAPVPYLLGLTSQIAYHHHITFYDASYIAVAQLLNLSFITADGKLENRVNDLPFIKLLSSVLG